VSPKRVPKGVHPQPGLPSNEKCHNQLARHPCAKWWAPQWAERGVPGEAPATSETREREQAALRRVTLTNPEE
jgi:hypothetical protein